MKDEQTYQALMAMTELEAAALAMLDTLERARAALRGMTYRQSAWEDMPKDEREALEALVELAGDRDKAWEVARTIAMKRRKAKLNRRSDREARVLVGARLPRQEAFEIQREAERRGQSLYSFVRETLYREVHWNFK